MPGGLSHRTHDSVVGSFPSTITTPQEGDRIAVQNSASHLLGHLPFSSPLPHRLLTLRSVINLLLTVASLARRAEDKNRLTRLTPPKESPSRSSRPFFAATRTIPQKTQRGETWTPGPRPSIVAQQAGINPRRRSCRPVLMSRFHLTAPRLADASQCLAALCTRGSARSPAEASDSWSTFLESRPRRSSQPRDTKGASASPSTVTSTSASGRTPATMSGRAMSPWRATRPESGAGRPPWSRV